MMGIDGLRTDLQEFREHIIAYCEEDVAEAASRAVEDVVKNLIFPQAIEWTPVGETGNLQSTAHVVRISALRWQIVYPMDYAIYVHEITRYSHDGNTRAKFLQQAMWQVEWVGYADLLAAKMSKYL